MAKIGKSMIRISGKTKLGETVMVKTRIIHPNNNGRSIGADNEIIPRLFIEKIEVFWDQEHLIEMDATAALSKNPMFNFQLKLQQSGKLRVVWTDNIGVKFEKSKQIKV